MKRFSKAQYKEWGKKGGNRLLIAEGRGEKIIIHHRNGKTERIN
jgi:hypothetical protein